MGTDVKTIAVIGAGPVGLEAALHGRGLGHDVRVYERGEVADHVRRWGHVTLFSPWRLNHSERGARTLRDMGVSLPEADDYLSGAEHAERYLVPLSRCSRLAGRVLTQTEVLQVGRERIGKSDLIGGPRERFPFRLLVRGPAGERIDRADVILDCSGTFGHPNRLGAGGVAAIGEHALGGRIAYAIEDVAGAARDCYEGRRVLVAGAGFSAATALDELTRLDGGRIFWVTRRDEARPYRPIPDDPLPARARLARRANALAAGADRRVSYSPATHVERIDPRDDGFRVGLSGVGGERSIDVDRILALVGYSPDNRIYRELQVHECYATGGPMGIAAGLLAAGAADCLAQTSAGPEALRTPEPGFFILGAKSYGRNSSFLIRLGLEQVQEAFSLI